MLQPGKWKWPFLLQRRKETPPALAYDQWSLTYDSQPDNLMLALDEQLTSMLLEELRLESAVIADVGCGTGRHWEKLQRRRPARLIGYDVSTGMLAMLNKKFPGAETVLLNDEQLSGLGDNSCDLLLSTLTIAHIARADKALAEWRRVLRPGGSLLITDYHPAALAAGARRTFRHRHQTVSIVNHVHAIEKIRAITAQLGLQETCFTESRIDESLRPFYEKQQALAIYDRFYGTPIIYGMLLMKPHVAAAG